MIGILIHLLKTGTATQKGLFPDLPHYSRGLPMVTDAPCNSADGCTACVDECPTRAISLIDGNVTLDRGLCVACGGCTDICPTGTLAADRRTSVAVRNRSDLVLTSGEPIAVEQPRKSEPSLFRRSLHIRAVSTGDNASDLESAATTNSIFDSGRFGVHVVASPRFADALLVTGPVGRAMREPLLRCYEAMSGPKLVIAAGSSAISGVPHNGGYAEANGVDPHLPVDVYIPGHPPHPWSIIHGIRLAME